MHLLHRNMMVQQARIAGRFFTAKANHGLVLGVKRASPVGQMIVKVECELKTKVVS